ncbi:epidermal retinol dehydrogenase 2-like isoform X2 [Paroedura picta]|uniref:epidermal retinol dehydrogenase 2-like isoform X2 n=1 Tax=Paroedura picta TaxID=143630 RepID=UPI004057ACF9
MRAAAGAQGLAVVFGRTGSPPRSGEGTGEQEAPPGSRGRREAAPGRRPGRMAGSGEPRQLGSRGTVRHSPPLSVDGKEVHFMTKWWPKWKNIFWRTMCKISSILETLKFILLLIYYYLEAFIMKFCQAPKTVAGEIVLITGSANGIGKQMALNFAQLGAILVLWDIDEEGNKETAALAEKKGALAVYTYKCDCGKREEIYAVADQVKKEVGDVNILINNAGILNGKNFIDLQDSEMEEILNVNTKAHFWTCKAFLPAMINCNHGHVVSMSSSGALIGANKLSEMIPGVQTTRPCLLPILDVEYVGKTIVDAILRDKFYLLIPPRISVVTLRIYFPRKVIFLLAEYSGIFSNFEHYKGQKTRKENKMND